MCVLLGLGGGAAAAAPDEAVITGTEFKETGTDVRVGVESCVLKYFPLLGCLANLASKSLLLINGGGTVVEEVTGWLCWFACLLA